jgi:hypothetical protein
MEAMTMGLPTIATNWSGSRPHHSATSARPLPHLRRDWARPTHVCTGTGLTPPTSAPGLGSLRPRLHRDWARASPMTATKRCETLFASTVCASLGAAGLTEFVRDSNAFPLKLDGFKVRGSVGPSACACVRACVRACERSRERSRVRACARACVRACERSRVRACARARVRACERASVRACVRAREVVWRRGALWTRIGAKLRRGGGRTGGRELPHC